MEKAQMAQFSPPAAFRGDPTILLVGQDDDGRWVVQENHGRVEGCFISRDAAICFAQAERAQFPGALVVITPQRVNRNMGRAA